MDERRADPRLLCADMVEVWWDDSRGRTHHATALLEDIATNGACLQLDRALPIDIVVTIEHSKGDMRGTVRYCAYQEIGYFVGVQFAADSVWSRSKFTPQHLLDLESLVMRQVKKSSRKKQTLQ
jgi:hypothetical protein